MIKAGAVASGKENISRLIDIHSNDENATPWAVAKAKVKLADWMLMFNKRNSAMLRPVPTAGPPAVEGES